LIDNSRNHNHIDIDDGDDDDDDDDDDNEYLDAHPGGLSIAVPGEVHGLHQVWLLFGKTRSWKRLVQPAINLTRNGFKISAAVADAMTDDKMVEAIKKDVGLRSENFAYFNYVNILDIFLYIKL